MMNDVLFLGICKEDDNTHWEFIRGRDFNEAIKEFTKERDHEGPIMIIRAGDLERFIEKSDRTRRFERLRGDYADA